MRVLVTGGGGFLGSHLVERFESDGHDVVVAHSADYDLTSMDQTARMFGDAGAELVFHLAAEVGGIGANRANPGRYWYANLTMGAHVLEQARLHKTPKLVIVGTVCSYPKFASVPFSEDELWEGYPEETNAPYGVAKKAVLVGAQAYREQYGLNAIFLLPANLYGPRDNFHSTNAHVIADLIRKMLESSDEVVLWGDGSPTREFLYVDDCVDGLVLAAERYDGADPVNLGASREISIRDLAELIADVTGFEGSITWDTTKPNGHGFGLHSGALAAREMGGSLSVHSDGPGKGAMFALELPLDRDQNQPKPEPQRGQFTDSNPANRRQEHCR
jgi:GDP-L-fucose synthase